MQVNLSPWLLVRYRRLSMLIDLDAAVDSLNHALAMGSEGHPDRAEIAKNLSLCLGDRFSRSHKMEGLSASIIKGCEAVDGGKNVSKESGHQARYLSNLGTRMMLRCEPTGSIVDIKDTISTLRNGIDLFPADYPNEEPFSLYWVSVSHYASRSSTNKKISKSVLLMRGRRRTLPENHLDRGMYWHCLVDRVFIKAQHTTRPNDLELARNASKEAFAVSNALPGMRLGSARVAGIPSFNLTAL